MTVEAFARAVVTIRRKYGGWVTSWGRTDLHSAVVGGFPGDPHTWDLGVDMLYHVRPEFTDLRMEAEALGLAVIREELKPHDHFQPSDMEAGPVTVYAGETKTWA
jgi:hypothetical protein